MVKKRGRNALNIESISALEGENLNREERITVPARGLIEEYMDNHKIVVLSAPASIDAEIFKILQHQRRGQIFSLALIFNDQSCFIGLYFFYPNSANPGNARQCSAKFYKISEISGPFHHHFNLGGFLSQFSPRSG